MVKRFIFPLLVLLLLSSCHYSVYSNAYPHLKKVQVLPFENQTTEFGMAEKALNQLSLEIRNDGRLKLVTQNPDCSLSGSILSFDDKIYSFDSANQVQDYQLSMVLDISFTDLISNEVIYENKTLRISEIYAVSTSSTASIKSKEEALNELFNKIFKTVVQTSLEAW